MAGNPKMVKGGPPINPHGAGAPGRRAKMNLAVWLREKWPAELIEQWLLMALQGSLPTVVVDADGTRRIVASPGSPPTFEQQLRIVQMILDRSLGAVPQHVHMEAEVRASVGVVAATFSPEKLRGQPADKVKALRDALMSVLTTKPVLELPEGEDNTPDEPPDPTPQQG